AAMSTEQGATPGTGAGKTGGGFDNTGWAYNPSAWSERIPIVVLGVVAMFVALYLASYQFGWVDSVWDPVFGAGTERVLDSELSHLFPVSDALLGGLGYLIDWVFGLVGGTKRYRTMPWAVVIFGIGIIPFGLTSIFLALAMPTIVGAGCFLCAVNAIIAVVMMPYAWDEIWLSLLAMRNMVRNGASFWAAFSGRASHLAF
ncbi:MAG: vitamin K epoxide reductase family protein, partial [Gemmatimonadota bacterium]